VRKIIIGSLLFTLSTLLAGAVSLAWWPASQPPSQAAPAQVGYLRVETIPPAVEVQVDSQVWAAPPELPAGRHTIRLVAPGYEPAEYTLDVPVGQTVTLRGQLVDTTPPALTLTAFPTQPVVGADLTARFDLADSGSGLASLDFMVDEEALHTEPLTGPADRLELEVAALGVGLHTLAAVLTDAAGNTVSRELYVDVQPEPGPTPSVDVATVALPEPGEEIAPAPVALPEPEVSPTPTSQPVVQVAPTPVAEAVSYTETVTIPAYGYTEALDTTGPRPRLDAAKVTPPQPRSFEAVILENDALRLTVLPELGGRLYQIVDKTTGQKILYNNPVIKPTPWGPAEMNWWLAVGGVEWAYPVEEHGYAWADAWQTVTSQTGEGVTLTLSHTDAPTQLAARVAIFLPTRGRYLIIAPTVTNQGDAPAQTQLWLNAALPAGPGQQVEFPATQVRVHSAGEAEGVTGGQVLPVQAGLTEWGHWQTWFGAFAAPTTAGTMSFHGDGNTVAIQRSFNPAETPGLKWFTWGPGGPAGEWGGTPYFEIWGGLTPDFDTYLNLPPGETRGWQEMWSVTDAN